MGSSGGGSLQDRRLQLELPTKLLTTWCTSTATVARHNISLNFKLLQRMEIAAGK